MINIYKIFLTAIIQLIFITGIISQHALPIGIDGKFNDWINATESYTDSQNDGGAYDMLSFSVSNDSAFLYITFALSEEIDLDESTHQLYLQIDTDNNAETGYSVNGIGSELGINFGERFAYFNTSSKYEIIYQDDIKLKVLPTVTADTFEIAIGRDVVPDGVHPLFTSDVIKLCFKDNATGGDNMPNIGTTFEYTFDETDVGEYDYINFAKNNDTDIRLLTYNVKFDGLTDPGRVDAYERIISKTDPDIITFNECWETNENEVQTLLNTWLDGSWECRKIDYGNITCTKFDIVSNYSVLPGRRITASVIYLPEEYPKNILIINAHFACCDDNAQRQIEADAVIDFLADVKSGEILDLPYGTPFVISGDLNLVGYSQQLTTLLTGGESQAPDWDDTDLNDVISFQTDLRMAYTWENSFSDYWPGRFDFAICSDVGLNISKSFTINTAFMSPERLEEYGLLQTDTHTASDHLPKVTDLIIENASNRYSDNKNNLKIYPNPSEKGIYTIENLLSSKTKEISVINITGQIMFYEENIQDDIFKLDLSKYNKGVYIIRLKTDTGETSLKIIR